MDCGDCSGSQRCWQEAATPGSGFLVRRTRLLEAGEALYRQGTTFEGPFIVTSGCVAVTELLPDGRERITSFRVPGEMVGLEGGISGVHRFGAQAVAPSTLCKLRWNAAANGPRSPAVLRSLLEKATGWASAPIPWPGLCAVDRVRLFVEDFQARTDQPLPMTRAQIGSYLGMAEETVVRAFKTLGARGLVRAAPD